MAKAKKQLAILVFAMVVLFTGYASDAKDPKQQPTPTELALKGLIIGPDGTSKELSVKIDGEYAPKRTSISKAYPFSECSTARFIDVDAYKKFAKNYVAKSGKKPTRVLDRLYNLAFQETIEAYQAKDIDREKAIDDITNELVRNAQIFSWKYRNQKRWKSITKIKELDKRTQPIISVMIYGNLPLALAEVYSTSEYVKNPAYKTKYRDIFLDYMTLLRFNRKHNIRMENQPESLPEYMASLSSDELRAELFAMMVEQLIDEGSYIRHSDEKIQ